LFKSQVAARRVARINAETGEAQPSPTIIPIVEGDGEEIAVPQLLRRWFGLLKLDWLVGEPIKLVVVPSNVVEIVTEVVKQNPIAIIIVRDNDGACYGKEFSVKNDMSKVLREKAEAVAGDVKVAVVVADYCYEVWLLACWQELLDSGKFKKKPLDKFQGTIATGAREGFCSTTLKRELTRILDNPRQRKYSETLDQPALSTVLPIDPNTEPALIRKLLSRAPSYGNLLLALERLTDTKLVSSKIDIPPTESPCG